MRTTLPRYVMLARHWLRRQSSNQVWARYLQQLGPDRVSVLWATRRKSLPTVYYRTPALAGTATAPSDTNNIAGQVTQGYSRGIAALGIQLHRVDLTGLTPDTRYEYAVESRTKTWFSFRTAPPTGSDTPFTFLAFGDYGNGTESQRRLRDQMARELHADAPSGGSLSSDAPPSIESANEQRASFIVTVGDNSQGSGTYRQLDMRVFSIYGKVFSRAAVFPALGNHDYLTDQAAPCIDLFDLARSADRYYSFDYGNAHFTVLDTNMPLDKAIQEGKDTGMLAWLKDDLQTTQRWKVVIGHHPPYNTGDRGCDARVREHIVPILEEHGVQLVLSGHQHNYQRSKPLRAGQVTAIQHGGIVYVVSGGGARAKHACQESEWLDFAICSASHGLYNRITVDGDRLHITAIDDSGCIRDRYTLKRNM